MHVKSESSYESKKKEKRGQRVFHLSPSRVKSLKKGRGGIYKVALLTIYSSYNTIEQQYIKKGRRITRQTCRYMKKTTQNKMLGPSAYAKPIKEYYILTSAQIRSPENEPAVIFSQ